MYKFHSGNCPICNNKMEYKFINPVNVYICLQGCWKEYSDDKTANLYEIFDKHFNIWFHTDKQDIIENKIKEIQFKINNYTSHFENIIANILTNDLNEVNRVANKIRNWKIGEV